MYYFMNSCNLWFSQQCHINALNVCLLTDSWAILTLLSMHTVQKNIKKNQEGPIKKCAFKLNYIREIRAKMCFNYLDV